MYYYRQLQMIAIVGRGDAERFFRDLRKWNPGMLPYQSRPYQPDKIHSLSLGQSTGPSDGEVRLASGASDSDQTTRRTTLSTRWTAVNTAKRPLLPRPFLHSSNEKVHVTHKPPDLIHSTNNGIVANPDAYQKFIASSRKVIG
jgi:hypothetical protein